MSVANSPIWDDETQSLYFVNFITSENQPSIFRYSFLDGGFYSAYIEGVTSPSFIVPLRKNGKKCSNCKKSKNANKCNDQYFAVGADEVLIVKWNGMSTEAIVVGTAFTVERNRAESRFDACGMPDRRGRFFGGTISPQICNATAIQSLYRYTDDGGLVNLVSGLKSSTGIVFDEKRRTMYHLDTCQLLITAYDWDPETGDICKCIFKLKFSLIDTITY